MNKKIHPNWKTLHTWKCGNRPTCNWTDDCPTGAQPPWPMPTTKWQANICTKTAISGTQKRRPTTCLCRTTTCQAHQTSSASLLCFQLRQRYMHTQHDHYKFFICCPGEHKVMSDSKVFKLSNRNAAEGKWWCDSEFRFSIQCLTCVSHTSVLISELCFSLLLQFSFQTTLSVCFCEQSPYIMGL